MTKIRVFRILIDYIFAIIGIVASIVTLVLFFDKSSASLSSDGRIAVIFLIVLFLWFFIENLYLKLKWGRERRYGQTLEIIADGFSNVHHLYRGQDSLNQTILACERLCNSVAKAFTLVTGTKCNVSIKVLAEDTDDHNNQRLKAVTFSRSYDTARNPNDNPVKHWVDQNTDFLELLQKIDNPKGPYFFSNRLPFMFGYMNTSFQVYGKPSNTNILVRYWRWTLPYKSTIIVPICPCTNQSSDTLVGFLCVDSPNLGAFKVKYDVPLLTGIGDGIYNTINKIAESQTNDNGSAK